MAAKQPLKKSPPKTLASAVTVQAKTASETNAVIAMANAVVVAVAVAVAVVVAAIATKEPRAVQNVAMNAQIAMTITKPVHLARMATTVVVVNAMNVQVNAGNAEIAVIAAKTPTSTMQLMHKM